MRILLTGASGLLGGYLLPELVRGGHEVVAWSGPRTVPAANLTAAHVDLADRARVAAAFAAARPDVVLHAAALSSVAQCFEQPEAARAINFGGTATLAELASDADARLLLVSTDLVFDGQRGGYREEDPPSPLSVYGQAKWAAEQAVLGYRRGTVVRASLLYGPARSERRGFFDQQVAALRAGRPCPLFVDEWRTPLALSTAAQALASLAVGEWEGIIHLGGPERMSRWEMGVRLAGYLGCDASACVPISRNAASSPEPRPRDASLDSSRWRALMPAGRWPTFEDALREMGV